MQQALLWAAAGTGFTFSMTALGAATVFFMKKQSTALMQRIFLGFAAGVMIAASVWSLLIPAIEETEQAGGVGWLPASGGFLLGILLMLLLDGLLPHLHNGAAHAEGLPSSFRRTTLLVLAVTLHNIPEGMAVGLSFARAAQHGGILSSTFNSGAPPADTTSFVTENSSSTEIPLLNASIHLTSTYSLFTSKTFALKYACSASFLHPDNATIQPNTAKIDNHLFILNTSLNPDFSFSAPSQ